VSKVVKASDIPSGARCDDDGRFRTVRTEIGDDSRQLLSAMYRHFVEPIQQQKDAFPTIWGNGIAEDPPELVGVPDCREAV
jgi:hypothetical protein